MDDLSNPVSTETAYRLFRSFFTEAKITPQASIVSVKTPLPLLHFLVWISPKRRRDLSWGWALWPSRADQPSKWAMLSPKADQPSKAQIAHSSLRVRPPTLSYRGGVACSGQSLRSELGFPRRDSRLAFASRPTGRPGSKLRLQSLLRHPN